MTLIVGAVTMIMVKYVAPRLATAERTAAALEARVETERVAFLHAAYVEETERIRGLIAREREEP